MLFNFLALSSFGFSIAHCCFLLQPCFRPCAIRSARSRCKRATGAPRKTSVVLFLRMLVTFVLSILFFHISATTTTKGSKGSQKQREDNDIRKQREENLEVRWSWSRSRRFLQEKRWPHRRRSSAQEKTSRGEAVKVISVPWIWKNKKWCKETCNRDVKGIRSSKRLCWEKLSDFPGLRANIVTHMEPNTNRKAGRSQAAVGPQRLVRI